MLQAGADVLTICEIGVNHNGDEQNAYKLIDAAVAAKANVAKFQLYKPEQLAGPGKTRDMLQRLLLPRDAYVRLNAYCKSKRIGFACSAFDADSLDFLLGNTEMAFVKISSGQGGNFSLLDAAKASGLQVIQSVKSPPVRERGWQYLWVVPEYPTPPEHANHKQMNALGCDGLSDHSGDLFMPLAAVALGAKVVECHLTLNKDQLGPDHKASLEPRQFSEMVRGIRAIEAGLA